MVDKQRGSLEAKFIIPPFFTVTQTDKVSQSRSLCTNFNVITGWALKPGRILSWIGVGLRDILAYPMPRLDKRFSYCKIYAIFALEYLPF